MENTLAIIDRDSFCYLCSGDTLQESVERIDKLIANTLDKTGSTSYYLFLSTGPYFRHNVNTDYKGKRPSSPLKYLKTLKNYLKEQYYAESFTQVEADDMVSYVQHSFLNGKFPQFSKSIVCAIDKDVKKGIPGHTFDYKKNEFSYSTKEESSSFIHLQSIMGDSTDNIKGIPGVGEVKAGKLLEKVAPELQATVAYQSYLDFYKEPGQALHEYQKNFKQVYLLQTDDDFLNNVGYVPELKDPITIINE